MADRAPDIFDTEPEGGSDEENVEEEYPEEEEEEKEEQENRSSSEDWGEAEDDVTDYVPRDPLRRNVGEDLKESFMAEIKRFQCPTTP